MGASAAWCRSTTRRCWPPSACPGSAQSPDDLGGGPLPGTDRAVHVAAPGGSRLGARPVHQPGGLAQRVAVPGPHVRPEERAVAAAGPPLALPVELQEVSGLAGPRAEV